MTPPNIAAAPGGVPAPVVPGMVPLPADPGGSDPLVQEVFTRYPALAYLLAIPEVRALLLEAVDPNKGFSPEEFAQRLYQTSWWRSTQAQVREWDATFAQDPATAQAQVRARVAEIRDIAGQTGLSLTDPQLLEFATQTLRFGIPTSSSEFRDALALLVPGFKGNAAGETGITPGGEFGLLFAQIKQTAHDYLMPLSDAEAWKMATQALAGDLNVEGLRVVWGQQAAARNPGLAAAIESGLTPAQFYAPTVGMVARELEIGPEQVDLMDPRWSQLLGIDDGKGGNRPMTLWEAQRYARSLPEWEFTKVANDESASMQRRLVESMGVAQF